MKLAILILCAALPCLAADFYVSPTGTGDGTEGNPGSLTNAVYRAGWAIAATGGDTIWLEEGSGSGYSGAPIFTNGSGFTKPWNVAARGNAQFLTFRARPFKIVVIDGQWNFAANATNLSFEDIRFYDSRRGVNATNNIFPNGPWAHFSVQAAYSGNRFRRCKIYNTHNVFETGGPLSVEDCDFWNNGVNGLEHIWYAASTNIVGNIVLWGNDATVNNFPSGFPLAVLSNNIFGGGATKAGVGGVFTAIIANNCSFKTPTNYVSNVRALTVSGGGVVSNIIQNNYFADPLPVVFDLGNLATNLMRTNVLITTESNQVNQIIYCLIADGSSAGYDIDFTSYFGLRAEVRFAFTNQSGTRSFAQWQALGFDSHSTCSNATWPTNQNFVFKCNTATNMGKIAIYNWRTNPTVSVEASKLSAVIDLGQKYTVSLPWGDIVASGTYSGADITIPMTNLPFPTPTATNWGTAPRSFPFTRSATANDTNLFLALDVFATNPIPNHAVLSGQNVLRGQVVIQ